MNERMRGSNEFVGGEVGDDRSTIHQHDSPRHPQPLGDIVGDEEERDVAAIAQCHEGILKIAAHDRIERAERLVAEQQRRRGHHGTRNPNALLFPSRKRARKSSGETIEGHIQTFDNSALA